MAGGAKNHDGARNTALLRRLHAARETLSGGRRQLVDSILGNLDEAVFLSSPELATRFKTDPATVVRTVQALGYSGFGEFSRDLRSHFLARVTPYRVMAAEASDEKGAAFHVQASLLRDAENVQQVHADANPSLIAELGKRLRRCRHVIVVAGDLEHTLAQFLAYGLSGLGIDASAPAGEGLALHRQRALTAADACIGIAFRRCLRVPVEAVQAARARGAFTLAITDAPTTPIARAAEQAFFAPIDGESFAATYVAPLAVINALLVACSHADATRTLAFLKPTEAEYGIGQRWYQDTPPRSRGRGRGNGRRGDGRGK